MSKKYYGRVQKNPSHDVEKELMVEFCPRTLEVGIGARWVNLPKTEVKVLYQDIKMWLGYHRRG